MRTASGGIREIRWLYPLNGYPELLNASDVPPTLVECSACSRREERLEVVLPFSDRDIQQSINTRAITPKVTTSDVSLQDRIGKYVTLNEPSLYFEI